MKSTFTSVKPAPSHRLESAAEATAVRRGAAGNHLRVRPHALKLEVEAKEAATAVLRGERGIARRLTRTGAAGWKPAGSQGRPLPAQVRNEFELAFGADLAAVRIHNDAASHIAADQEHAVAFTSGRDIYLRRGALDRRLLAHEVAHTIQQTAVAESNGRVRVTDSAGDSDVQYERKSGLSSTSPLPDIDGLLAIHKAAHTKNPAKDRFAKDGDRVVKAAKDFQAQFPGDRGYWTNMATSAKSMRTIVDEDVPLWQFQMDLLKLNGEYEAAVHILLLREDLKTAFYSDEMFPALSARRDPDKLIEYGLRQDLPFFKKYGANRFYETTWDFLVGPTRAIPVLGKAGQDFAADIDAALKRREAPAALIPNEQFFIAVAALRDADKQRQKILSQAVQRVAPGVEPNRITPLQRRDVTKEVAARTAVIASGETISGITPEAMSIVKEVAARMQSAADAALLFWEAAHQLLLQAERGQVLSNGTAAAAVVRAGSARPEYLAFLKEFRAPLEALFTLDEDGFPQAAESYDAARNALADSIRLLAQKHLELPMIAEAKKTGGKADYQAVVFFGALLIEMFALIDVLRNYNVDQDKTFGSTNQLTVFSEKLQAEVKKPAPDYRIKNRLDVAGFLWKMSTIAPMGEIQRITDEVLTAKQPGTKRSFLALLSEWWPDPGATYHDLIGDFDPYAEIESYRPLRAIDVMRMFDFLFNQAYIAQMLRVLAEQNYTFDAKNPQPKIAGAYDEAKAKALKPTRYYVQDWRVSLMRQDKQLFWELITEHPKTIAFLEEQKKKAQGPHLLSIVPLQLANVFIWILPSLDLLVNVLKTMEPLNQAISFSPLYFSLLKRTPTIEEVKQLPAAAYLEYFSDVLKDPVEAKALAAQIALFRRGVEAGTETARETARGLERLVSIRDRTNWVAKRLVPLLEAWEPGNPVGTMTAPEGTGIEGKLVNATVPLRVANEVGALATYMRPAEDRPLHFAVSVLELARLPGQQKSALAKLKEPRDRWKMDLVQSWVTLLAEAEKTIVARRDELKRVMMQQEIDEPDFIESRLTIIRDVIRDLEATRTRVELAQQSEYGMQGLRSYGGEQALLGLGHAFEIKKGEQFTIGDIRSGATITWTIDEVYTDFIYHPKVGSQPAKLYLTDANGEPFMVDDKPVEASASEKAKPLLRITKNNGPARDLYFNRRADLTDLDSLTFAVNMEAMVRSLNNLAELTKSFVELTMEAIELIPGMQWMMGVRIFMSIVEFLASPEFQILKEEIGSNPKKYIEQAVKILFDLVKPEKLWEYILFGNAEFDRLHGDAKPPPSRLKGKTGIGSKLMNVLMRLFRFSEELLGDMGRLQTRVRHGVEAASMIVLARPVLATVLRFVAIHFDEMLLAIEKLRQQGGDLAVDDVVKAFQSWPDKVAEIMTALENPNLPEKVVPMGQIAEIITELVLARLGFKYRLAGNVALSLLRLVKKDQVVFDMIGEALGQAFDPNYIWNDPQKGYKKKIEKQMGKAGAELARIVFEKLSELPPDIIGSRQEEFRTRSRDAAAKAAAPFGWNPATPARLAAPPSTAGIPLSAANLADVQSSFGQDFSHVRIHADAPAAAYTAGLGAAAVTSGSHIYLRPGIATSTSMGSHVLRHELAHVVQQTGSRPLGHSWSPAPRQGLSSLVRHDPALEFEAESAARTAGRAAEPSSRATGPQAISLKAIAAEFLMKMTGTGEIVHDAEKAKKLGQIPQNIRNRTSALGSSFQAAAKVLTAESPFNHALALLRTYLSDTSATAGFPKVQQHIERVIADAMVEEKVDVDKQGNKTVTYALDTHLLKTSLERYVLGAAGIQVDITLKVPPGKASIVEVQAIKVTYVHLPLVHGREELWREALEGVVDPAERPKMIPRLRTFLYNKDISIGVWQVNKYRLRPSVITDLEEQARRGGSGSIEPRELPPKAAYLDIDGAKTSETLNHIGLRIGEYVGANQRGTGRESHHMTQFLLLDFFSNDGTVPAFVKLKKDGSNPYYGVQPSGTKVESFTAREGTVKIHEYWDKRGGKMPCILLSREAHRMPGLHITTQLDDLENAPDSPAGVVQGFFRDALESRETGLGTDFFSETNISTWTAPGKRERLRKATYLAMQDTYHEVWEARMKKALERALLGPERKYYNSMAEQDGRPKTALITEGEMKGVYSAAVTKLETGLRAGGWV